MPISLDKEGGKKKNNKPEKCFEAQQRKTSIVKQLSKEYSWDSETQVLICRLTENSPLPGPSTLLQLCATSQAVPVVLNHLLLSPELKHQLKYQMLTPCQMVCCEDPL